MNKMKAGLSFEDYVKGIDRLEPEQQIDLIEMLSARLRKSFKKRVAQHSIMELDGLGAELWKGIDPQRYIDEERQSWA